jgi:addiction module HigA family antidote
MSVRVPSHPGAILREDVMPELGLTVTEVAARLDVSRVALSRVLHEHAAISPSLALRLEAVGLSSARVWLAMQSAHDLAVARQAGVPRLKPLGVA